MSTLIDCVVLVTVHRAIYIYIHAKLCGQSESETTSAITITFPGSVNGDLLSDKNISGRQA